MLYLISLLLAEYVPIFSVADFIWLGFFITNSKAPVFPNGFIVPLILFVFVNTFILSLKEIQQLKKLVKSFSE